MTNLDSILKSRDISLPTKVHLVKAMVFPVVKYGCESWTVKKAERRRIDAFELWCWRRLLRVPWTARRSNQNIPYWNRVYSRYIYEWVYTPQKFDGFYSLVHSITGSGRSPGEGNGNPLQYSCRENSINRGAWWATVHGVAKSRTRLSNFTSLFHSLVRLYCNFKIIFKWEKVVLEMYLDYLIIENDTSIFIIFL